MGGRHVVIVLVQTLSVKGQIKLLPCIFFCGSFTTFYIYESH